MNIFKKLINWLIHILGGYTEKEYTALQIELTTANREAKEYKEISDYWFVAAKSIKTERENYLAMLNCHNATASAAQNNASGVAGAIDTIKAYCKSKGSCDECALYNKNSGCEIHEIPCYWEV